MTTLAPTNGSVRRLRTSRLRGPARGAMTLVGAVATILVASFIIFLALSFAPGDPVSLILGSRASDAQRAVVREELGLDKPVLVRFWDWLLGLSHGDLGRSLVYRTDVTGLLEPRLGTTFALVTMATLIIVIFWVSLGALGGAKRKLRSAVSAITGLGVAIPGFVAASVLISVFAVSLGWFPTYGSGSGFLDVIWHLTLPALALSLGWGAYVAALTAAAVREQSEKEHVSTAIGRGLDRRTVFTRHVLRNAAIPVVTASGLTVAGLVAGSVIVESAFAIDGVGSLLVKSVASKDYVVVMPIAVLIVTLFVAVTTILDLIQIKLDPRLRSSS